jgi:hypothetical protein
MICARTRVFYYDIRSDPLGLKLVGALSAGALQKYQVAHVEFLQFDLRVSPCLSHPVLRPKPDAHRMYAQDQVVIHTVRM